MVKRRRLILLITTLLAICLIIACSWLLTTRSGARWAFDQLGDESPVQIEVNSLEGSLLGDLELQQVSINWTSGRLTADRLQFSWNPVALLQRRLQLVLLRGTKLDLQLSGPKKKQSSERLTRIPDLKLLFKKLGSWQLELQSLEVDRLQISAPGKQVIHLTQLAAGLLCTESEISLNGVELDGDWGRWRATMQLAAGDTHLNSQLSWHPPRAYGSIEALDARFSLLQTAAGALVGPIELKAGGENGTDYRLAGDLQLDLKGLQLRELQLDHGSDDAGLVRGAISLGWQAALSWQTALELVELDLASEVGQRTKISGKVGLQGTNKNYSGRVELQNIASGWQQLSLNTDIRGDADQLSLTRLQGGLLGGTVQGDIGINWRDGISSLFKLESENLQLARLPGGPSGNIDLRFDGWARIKKEDGLQLGGEILLTRGVLLDRDFSGELRGEWQGGRQLKIEKFDLSGAWGTLEAHGELQRQLELQLKLVDAAVLWPSLAGQGELAGWLAWTADWPHGELNARLDNLGYQDGHIGKLLLQGKRSAADAEVSLQLRLSDLQQGKIGLDGLALELQGLPESHRLKVQASSNEGAATLQLQGKLRQDSWQGRVTTLDLIAQKIESFNLQKPLNLNFEPEKIQFSEMLLQGDKGGSLSLKGRWNRQDDSALVEGLWRQFDLSWLNLWLAEATFDGESSGSGKLAREASGEVALDLQVDYAGAVGYAGQNLQFDKAQFTGHWNRQGLAIDAELLERRGGMLKLMASSSGKAGFYLPQQGDLQLELVKFPLGILNEKMPTGIELQGLLAAEIDGSWFAGDRFSLTGKAGVERGVFSFQGAQSRLELPLEVVELGFDWQAEQLQAEARLGLGAGDGLVGNIKLQLPARWPFALLTQAPLSGELQLRLGNLGILSLLAPEQLADFAGEIGGGLRIGGSLHEPDFEGDLHLANGRLNLPQLGIVLDQIEWQAVFRPERLKIERITLNAGGGRLKGQGEVLFTGWKPKELKAELSGDKILIVNLPELRVMASPDLQLVGSAEGFTLGGLLKIPELRIVNWHPQGRVVRSDDVVYIDQLPKAEAPAALKLNIDLGIELGERVVVKDRGLDVKLKGNVRFNRVSQGGLLARGQIDIPEGSYSAYGVKLPITSGRLYFSGGPADNPTLDIIAEKKVNDVTAGVAVGGTVRRPEIRLISDPALGDTDILSYIVLGRPTVGGSGDFSALSLAAGALLSASDSASFQQQLQNMGGIDVLDVDTGEDDTLETSVVTVGKYLTPELYLSYGNSLSGKASQIQLRYSPNERVDVESQFGEVSGADIYYRIEFNDFSYQ